MDVILAVITSLMVAYPIYAVRKIGNIPESFSATYYLLKEKGWLFQMVMGLSGIFLLPVWISVSDESVQYWAFLSCSGLLFTAAAPAFHLKLEGAVHYSAAVVCCVSALLWQVLSGMWDITLLFSFVSLMLYLQWKQWCFWLEVAVMSSVIANLWRLV